MKRYGIVRFETITYDKHSSSYLIRICTVAKDLPELRPKNVGAIFWNTIRGYDLEAQSS